MRLSLQSGIKGGERYPEDRLSDRNAFAVKSVKPLIYISIFRAFCLRLERSVNLVGMKSPSYQTTYTVTYFKSEPYSSRSLYGEVWRNAEGQLDRGFGLPAVVAYDPGTRNPSLKMWYWMGRRSREGGPAIERIDPDTGVVVFEAWLINGIFGGHYGRPGMIVRCPETGRVIEERYIDDGKKHRWHGPAVVKYDPKTGKAIEEQYWAHGKRVASAAAHSAHLKTLFPSP